MWQRYMSDVIEVELPIMQMCCSRVRRLQSCANVLKKESKVKLQLFHVKCSLVSFKLKLHQPKSYISSFIFKLLLLEKSSLEQ